MYLQVFFHVLFYFIGLGNGMINEAEFVAFFAGLTNSITDEEIFNKGELVVILSASGPLRVDDS